MQATDSFDDAFPALFRAAFRAALGITRSQLVADDLANEAMFRASVRWHRIHDRAPAWVVHVVANLAIDHLRREARRPRHERERNAAITDPANGVVDRIDLYRALRNLPKRQREVVVLRYFGDLSEAEIGGQLGIAPGTVKTHANRGLNALRTALADHPEPNAADIAGANHE